MSKYEEMNKAYEFRKQTEEGKYKAFSLMCQKVAELEKENEQLRADYEKQKEINKELVDDIAELHKRIRELETTIKLANEREAQDIRARFPQ